MILILWFRSGRALALQLNVCVVHQSRNSIGLLVHLRSSQSLSSQIPCAPLKGPLYFHYQSDRQSLHTVFLFHQSNSQFVPCRQLKLPMVRVPTSFYFPVYTQCYVLPMLLITIIVRERPTDVASYQSVDHITAASAWTPTAAAPRRLPPVPCHPPSPPRCAPPPPGRDRAWLRPRPRPRPHSC